MKIGGYQIIDLDGKTITTNTALGIDVYDIIKNAEKPVMIRGLKINGTTQKPCFTTFRVSGDTVVCDDVYGYTLTIDDDNKATLVANTNVTDFFEVMDFSTVTGLVYGTPKFGTPDFTTQVASATKVILCKGLTFEQSSNDIIIPDGTILTFQDYSVGQLGGYVANVGEYGIVVASAGEAGAVLITEAAQADAET